MQSAPEDQAAIDFAKLYKGKLRFCHDAGAWFIWDTSVWRQDRKRLAFHYAREHARDLSKNAEERVQYIASRTSFADGVERFARSDPVFAVTSADWDTDPMLLGTPDGTVDLRTGILRQADPAEGITKSTVTAPLATVDCPRWLAFLDEAAGGDEEFVRFLQQWAGYCLTGSTQEHALIFVYGAGGEGKSTFLNTIAYVLHDYATTAPMETFTSTKTDKHPTDLAGLRGARFVCASETEEGRAWAEARIKSMTGGDPITARFMRRDFFTYVPQFKLAIMGNHRPALLNVDDAMRRRLNIVPFVRKPARPDPLLGEILKAEAPGILRWMIDGCLDWQKNGLVRPAIVKAETDEYFSAQDTFGDWLAERCDAEPGNKWKTATSGDLYRSWSAYAYHAGESAQTHKAFAERMLRAGFRNRKGANGVRLYDGVRLRSDEVAGGA